MRVALGSDHAGYQLKTILSFHLRDWGYEIVDLGTTSAELSVDYPDFGAAVGQCVTSGRADLGVAVCGTGIGIAIAANKVPGVRAAVVHDVTSARLAREHNHANVLCMGARVIGPAVAIDALAAWLTATPVLGRHAGRVAKIGALEKLVGAEER